MKENIGGAGEWGEEGGEVEGAVGCPQDLGRLILNRKNGEMVSKIL